MSEPTLPMVVVKRIVDAVRENPGIRPVLISTYLPLLVDYVSPHLSDPRVFARFKHVMMVYWTQVFGDIPIPELEGVFNYDTFINKLFQHVMDYRERVFARLRLDGIYSGAEIERMVRMMLGEAVFSAVLDILKFLGELGGV